MVWADMIRKCQALGVKRDRAFRTFMRRTMKLARAAHPATGGNECLVHNWGNDEARRIWADGWRRWRSYSAAADRRHREWVDAARKAEAESRRAA